MVSSFLYIYLASADKAKTLNLASRHAHQMAHWHLHLLGAIQ